MNFSDLEKLYSERRSVRRWKNEPVPEELLTRAIMAAGWAPSSGGKQTYRVYVITNPEKIAAIGAAVQEVTDYLAALPGSDLDRATVERWQKTSAFFIKAPALVAVTAGVYQSIADKLQAENMDENRVREINRCREIGGSRIQTVGSFTAQLLLALHLLGLGACYMSGPVQAKPAIEEIIGAGPDEDFVALVPVGWPDETPKAPPHKTLEELVTFIR